MQLNRLPNQLPNQQLSQQTAAMIKKIKVLLLLAMSHTTIAICAFMLGIYTLPILMAPADPSSGALALSIKNTRYVATISDNLTDSDWLHWGKGTFSIGDDYIVFQGTLAPGPDYRLYLSPSFVQTEADFNQLKSSMIEIGEVNSFGNYIHPLNGSMNKTLNKNVNIEHYNTVIIWCESFNQFITSAQFKN